MDKTRPSLTLLLAEDDDDLRQLLADALRSDGYQVIEARDERQWSQLLASRPHIDMVVADVSMPGRHDGVELANQVRQQHAGVPILLITGHAYEDIALPEGAGYLAKPFAVGELLRYVETTLRSDRGVPKND